MHVHKCTFEFEVCAYVDTRFSQEYSSLVCICIRFFKSEFFENADPHNLKEIVLFNMNNSKLKEKFEYTQI